MWSLTDHTTNGLTFMLEGGRNLLVIHSLLFRHRVAYYSAEFDEAADAAWIVRLGLFSSVKVSFCHSLLSDSQFTKVRLPELEAPHGSHGGGAFNCNIVLVLALRAGLLSG